MISKDCLPPTPIAPAHATAPCLPSAMPEMENGPQGAFGRWLNYGGDRADLLLGRGSSQESCATESRSGRAHPLPVSSLRATVPGCHDASNFPLPCPSALLSCPGASQPGPVAIEQNKLLLSVVGVRDHVPETRKVTKTRLTFMSGLQCFNLVLLREQKSCRELGERKVELKSKVQKGKL